MSTHSRIGIQEPDGSVTSIYCQFDGYPSHHGPILRDHYATEESVRALIALGDLSRLGETIGEKHDFHDPPDGVCSYYMRDRGETDCHASSAATVTTYAEIDEDYKYLFDPVTKDWFLIEVTRHVMLKGLQGVIAEEAS